MYYHIVTVVELSLEGEVEVNLLLLLKEKKSACVIKLQRGKKQKYHEWEKNNRTLLK